MAQIRNFDNSLFRKSFSKNADKETIPHLICVQKESYEKFLQLDIEPQKRENVGIQSVFNSFFPVSDSSNRLTVEFISYDLKQPRYEASECLFAGRTFSSSLSAQLRLILWHQDDSNSIREIKSIKEQEVYLCEIPLMTNTGSFIVNGAERVIVSQMRRAPGVFFDSDNSKVSGSKSYTAKIIPYIGSWIDFEFDGKDVLHFRVDKKRKIPVTSLLRAIGYNTEAVINNFYGAADAILTDGNWALKFDAEAFMGKKISYNLVCATSGEIVIKEGTKINRKIIEKLDNQFKYYLLTDDVLLGYVVAKDLIELETGELLLEAGSILTPESLEILKKLLAETKDLEYVMLGSVPTYSTNLPKIIYEANPSKNADFSTIDLRPYVVPDSLLGDDFYKDVESPNFKYISTLTTMCSGSKCAWHDDKNRLYYFDTDHLTLTGAHALKEPISRSLDSLLGSPGS